MITQCGLITQYGLRLVQGRSQGTTLSASDLHNARATILNPFYNMEYKIIKKIRQNTAWIEADILGKNLTPNRCNAYGSCRVSDQGTTLRASDLHNARATILNPFNNLT